MPFTLPPLPYDYNALEPHIDEMTMRIHHDKHHGAYVDNLNKALEKYPEWQSKSIEDILKNIGKVPEDVRTAVNNNGGGHSNHSIFWTLMAPAGKGGGEPTGELATAITGAFGDFAKFKTAVNDAGVKRFGSGWSWLCFGPGGKLIVESFPNQDSPYSKGYTPILGVDVWEHAYYLKYQNRRADYLAAWWNVVNWTEVAARFKKGPA